MRYELTDLRLFLAIAEAKSLSTGAAVVHITASSASYRLKNLEHALGVSLFVRHARGMDLTPEGDVALVHVRELLQGVQRMHGDLSGFNSGLKGHVRLTGNSSALHGFLIPSLGRFLEQHPEVNAEVDERPSELIPTAVLSGEADIGLFAGKTEVAGIRLHAYARDHLMLAVPREHPLAGQTSVTLEAALQYDFVCMGRGSSNFLFLRDAALKIGRALRTRMHAQSFESVLSLVQAGVGVALVPQSVALPLRHEKLCLLPLAEPWAARELWLAVKDNARLPFFAQALLQFLCNDALLQGTRERKLSMGD